tara:strand:+ start:1182 stop:1337 length:156 start_codon:yes stop_codon:yes gene_type:complete
MDDQLSAVFSKGIEHTGADSLEVMKRERDLAAVQLGASSANDDEYVQKAIL